MSSLHSCHWDWCRFTTVLHDDLVQHVMKVHVDTAEPVRRKDVSLIRQVEGGSLEYPGQLLPIMLEADLMVLYRRCLKHWDPNKLSTKYFTSIIRSISP
jgi:hypothetical protein